MTYTLVIEDATGYCSQHGYHLGTHEPLARHLAAEMFHARIKHDMPTNNVALMLDGKMVDCFDGTWSSEHRS